MLEVAVIDSGTRIKENIIDKLFSDKVASIRKEQDATGTGIGLSIAGAIVKAHKGKIKAENNVGQRAKVTFTIPISGSITTKTEEVKNSTKELKVVVVDDEEACLLSMPMMLMKTNYDLKLYSNPKEALEQLKASPKEADIILLDIMMQNLMGLAF